MVVRARVIRAVQAVVHTNVMCAVNQLIRNTEVITTAQIAWH